MASDEWDEYKLLQDKIDRIGAFHFQVRGWVITLVTGVSVAGMSDKLPGYAFIFAMLFVGLFWALEKRQSAWQDAFEDRVVELERRLIRQELRSKKASTKASSTGSKRAKVTRAPAIVRAVRRAKKRLEADEIGRLVLCCNRRFYFLMAGVLGFEFLIFANWQKLIVTLAPSFCSGLCVDGGSLP